MKKNSIVLISFVLVFLLVHGYLAYGSNYAKKNDVHEEIVHELLFSRTSIMNRALYNDEEINDIFVELEKIESGKLLEEDVEALLYARTNSTDYIFISNVEVLNVELLGLQGNTYNFKALIQWIVIETEELKEDVEYFIQIVQEDGKFFLTSLEPVEQI